VIFHFPLKCNIFLFNKQAHPHAMKKIILMSLTSILLLPSARSQVLIAILFGDKLNTPNIEFGLNIGANITTLQNYPKAKFQTGLNLGLYFNFKLSDHFYLHPEMLFMNQMGARGVNKSDLPFIELQHETLETWTESNYFTLVFLPRYKLTNQLYFEAGLHGSYLLTADDYFLIKPENESELQYKIHARPRMNKFDVGADVGLGYKFGKGDGVNLSLRYSNGFINILKDGDLEPERNRGIHVHVGIPIGVGKQGVQKEVEKIER
jgi:hypothetical protein